MTLHDKKNLLYTYCNYPVVDWNIRMTADGVKTSGEMPKIKIKDGINLEKTIVYTHGNLQEKNSELYDKLIKEGYKFLTYADIGDDAGIMLIIFFRTS